MNPKAARFTRLMRLFIASVGPWNQASLNLTAQLGFHKIGEQMDEIDGLEYVFETEWPRPASEGHAEGP